MQFLCDECTFGSTVNLLRSLGHSVTTVCDLGSAGALDPQILSRAVEDNKVLITVDSDFGDIILYPPSSHCGIIVLKISRQTETQVHERLKEPLRNMPNLNNTLAIIDKNKYRLRK